MAAIASTSCLVVLGVRLLVLLRQVHLVELAGLGPLLVELGSAGEQVDDAVEVGAVADRDLDRHHLGREMRLHVVEDPLEVGALLVHLGDEDNPREVQVIADLPGLLGPDLDAAHRAHHDHRRVGRVQRGRGLAQEIEVARGVDQVELGIHPLGERDAEADGVFAFDFVGSVVGERGAVGDHAVPAARAGDEGECIYERGFSGGAVADEGHIPDRPCVIDLHGSRPPAGVVGSLEAGEGSVKRVEASRRGSMSVDRGRMKSERGRRAASPAPRPSDRHRRRAATPEASPSDRATR